MKILLCLLALISLNARADFKMKAGLWEVSNKTQMNGKDMSAQMAKAQESMKKLPPESRKMMEDMMKSKGLDLSAGPGKARVCYSTEMIEKRSLMQSQGKHNCHIEDKKELSDGVSFTFKCDNSSGKTEYHMTSENSYTGKMDITTGHGAMHMDVIGKFLTKDCGDVKPLLIPEK